MYRWRLHALKLHWMSPVRFPQILLYSWSAFCEMFQTIFASAARAKWCHVSTNISTVNRILHFNLFMDAVCSCFFPPKTQENLNLQSHCGHQWRGSAGLRCGQHLRLRHLSYVEPAAYPGIRRLTSQQAWARVATGGTTCDTWDNCWRKRIFCWDTMPTTLPFFGFFFWDSLCEPFGATSILQKPQDASNIAWLLGSILQMPLLSQALPSPVRGSFLWPWWGHEILWGALERPGETSTQWTPFSTCLNPL